MEIHATPALYGLDYKDWWPGQRETLQTIADSDAPIVALNARTGFGKSGIPTAMSKIYQGGVLVMTKTLQLQEQYRKYGAALVKGRPNFICPVWNVRADEVESNDCGESCTPFECEYRHQRYVGEISPFTVTNYAYGLRVLRGYEGGAFAGRPWMALDEAHGLLSVMESVLQEEWDEEAEEAEKHDQPLPPPVPLWPTRLFGKRFALHADRVLLMSATLQSHKLLAWMLGVPASSILYIDADNTWPDGSPLNLWPVAHLNAKAGKYEYDEMAKAIRQILRINPNTKGLIHPHSYKVLKELQYRLHTEERIDWALGGGQRNRTIERFMVDRGPRVLCATAVNEGLDLPYQLGFQVITKVPWPDLGDQRTAARMRQNREWYDAETIGSIEQAVGRVQRAPDDYGETWLLDASAVSLMQRRQHLWAKHILRQTTLLPA